MAKNRCRQQVICEFQSCSVIVEVASNNFFKYLGVKSGFFGSGLMVAVLVQVVYCQSEEIVL